MINHDGLYTHRENSLFLANHHFRNFYLFYKLFEIDNF